MWHLNGEEEKNLIFLRSFEDDKSDQVLTTAKVVFTFI